MSISVLGALLWPLWCFITCFFRSLSSLISTSVLPIMSRIYGRELISLANDINSTASSCWTIACFNQPDWHITQITMTVDSCRLLKSDYKYWLSFFMVRSAWALSNGCMSPSHPNSGKAIAQSKGVHCEVEFEGSQRQTSGLTNRNFIQGIWPWIRLPYKLKSNSYLERLV